MRISTTEQLSGSALTEAQHLLAHLLHPQLHFHHPLLERQDPNPAQTDRHERVHEQTIF